VKVDDKGSKPKPNPVLRTQAIGEYCHGAEVAECRTYYGRGLERICATCPD